MSHYAYHNISKESKLGSFLSIETISNLAESFLYVYLGLTAVNVLEPEYSDVYFFILVVLGLTITARILTVLVPMMILKIFERGKYNVKWNEMILIMVGGMIRGPIAFALSL